MTTEDWVLVVDQGTTSTRAIVFDPRNRIRASAARSLAPLYPRPGWIEQDPEEIWRTVVECVSEAWAACGADSRRIGAIGIANQRETTLVWDRVTGRPLCNAIVWQDRRTSKRCRELFEAGHGAAVAERTGLVIDPYFSATKLRWILDERPDAQPDALAFGTVDSFLLWRLTGGRVHATDATNAGRTMLFDIRRLAWSDALLDLFGVPRSILPEVRDTAGPFGRCEPRLFGRAVRITAMAGDQHAALVGQGCLAQAATKCTYGTGAFAMTNTGGDALASRQRLLTTLAWRLATGPVYALEGAIFNAGAAVQWLSDGLGLFDDAAHSELLAGRARETPVTMVPAFTGLGAPHWDADARGAVLGLTRDTGRADLARAALDSVCFQTADLLAAMQADGAPPPTALRVDGGMTRNRWFGQRLADILDLAVERGAQTEATALGAAHLARLGAGMAADLAAAAGDWRPAERFEPRLAPAARTATLARWADAVARVRTRPDP